MIKRYSREEISKIWSQESKFSYYLKVELAVLEAYYKLGKISNTTISGNTVESVHIISSAKISANNSSWSDTNSGYVTGTVSISLCSL